jgi:predicted transglutaminase-like cysteine proteinase
MVGDKSYQKQVEVRMDPTVTVTTADLQLQEEVTLKLRSMLSSTNDALRLLDSVKGQLEQIEKTVKDRVPDAPDELTKAITGYKKQVDTLMSSLARPQGEGGIGGGSKLSEKLGTLFFEIDGVNAAPTPAQKESFAELQTEFQQRLNEVNRFVNETVPKMNDTLRRFNAPTIIAGKPIELPR